MRDLNEISELEPESYDLCIIGTGPAGIVLCSELAATGLRICVLESGGWRKNGHNDELRKVISEGIEIKDHSRERVVGGASSTWSGLSAPLDGVDMAERPFLKVPGWPISREELRPYWAAAGERYRFPKFSAFENFSHLRSQSQLQPKWKNISEKIFLAAGQPQRFGKEFQALFEKENITLFYNATVLNLEGIKTGDKNRVGHAVVVTPNGKKHIIQARFFILATGGIENVRILLNSTNLCQEGLGNEYDQVGRYFMNHPKNNFGVIKLAKPFRDDASYFFGCLKDGYAGYAGLRLKEETQLAMGVLNSYIRLEPIFPWSDNSGVGGAIFLAKKAEYLLNKWKKSQSKETTPLRDYAETGDDNQFQTESNSWSGLIKAGLAVLFHLPSVVQYTYARLVKKNKPVIKKIRVRNFMEMEPNPENRVTLSREKDLNGQFIPLVSHRPSELDRRSLVALHCRLAEELKENSLGELKGVLINEEKDWPINQDASHHMGATRMGHDPATSVVNQDLRLHGAENVYCAGSSVFPTSGCANPTFTICALSIRLAEHLKKIENRILE